MTKQEMKKRIKELYKMKGKTFAEKFTINKELCYLERQLERIEENERP